MLRRFFLIVLCTFCSLNAFNLSAAGLKVGISVEYPPLAYKQDGRIVGIEADSLTAVGKILGLKMTPVEMPFTRLITALEEGEIDVIMSGMSVTPERSERVQFLDPYLKIGQMAITTTSKVAQFAQPWAIYREGVRIGIEPGTTGAIFAERELKDAELNFYTDPPAAFAGLRKDDIDLYIHDAPTSWLLATNAENGDLISLYNPLTDESLAWAVRKDDQHVAKLLSSALATMKSNGTLRYILNRWIPVTVEVK
ncbi:MAG: ABC-type amino acid transport substrate-binding protein [Halioglobus sp.]|jgi:ABC-type amino acid transport substrate-binding protein